MTTTLEHRLTSQTDHGLSCDELSRFDAFGFLVLRGLFAQEVDELSAGFEVALREAPLQVVSCPQFYAAAPSWSAHARQAVFDVVEGSSSLARLRRDPRVTEIVRQIVGAEHVATDSVSLFNCDTHWHNDGLFAPSGRPSILFMWYLDRLTAETGALRVIPGSHHPGPFRTALDDELMSSDKPLSRAFGTKPHELPAIALDVEPGDLVLIDYRVFHSSFHGGVRRRLITVGWSPTTVEIASE
jgi:hypothetical protein